VQVAFLLVLLAGLGTGAVALSGAERLLLPSCAFCVLGSVGWVLTNGPYEGPILLVVTDHNGLTLSDLLSLVGGLLALLLLRDLRALRRPRLTV
jgi:hypothetical protein